MKEETADKVKKAGEHMGLSTISLGTVIAVWTGLVMMGVPLPNIAFDTDLEEGLREVRQEMNVAQQATYKRIDSLSADFTKSACIQAEDKLSAIVYEMSALDEELEYFDGSEEPAPDRIPRRMSELKVSMGKWQIYFDGLIESGLCL